MNPSVTISVQRPFLERCAHDAVQFIVRVWKERRARRALTRSIDAMADLSVAVLRDIGGSDELLNRAAARREANDQCIGEMRMLAGYRCVDPRFW